MAARENQGLHVALIVFAGLTILTVVSTYWFFSRYQEQLGKAKLAAESTATAMADRDKAANDRSQLLTLIGAGPNDSVPDLVAAEKAKIAGYAPLGFANLPPDQQTLDKVVKGLADAVNTANNTVVATQETMKKHDAAAAADIAKAQADAKQVSDAAEAARTQFDEQTKQYNASVAALGQSKADLEKHVADLNHSIDQLKADAQSKLAAANVRIGKLSNENGELKLVVDRYNRPNPEVSGGKILFVNQSDNTVMLNIGADDGLQRRTTFNVYPQGTANVTNLAPKGRVEVTSTTPHTAVARIVDNAIADPLLPGDLVHSIEWAPGQHPHYAIAGVIDLNGSGADQTQRLKEMIESTGGIVDAWLEDYKDSDGKLTARVKGSIGPNTRYLIRGDSKENSVEGAARVGPTSTLITEANQQHVEQIGLSKFLYMMGYVAPTDVGPGAAAATPRPTTTGGPNNAFQDSFRPRQPGAVGAAGAGATP